MTTTYRIVLADDHILFRRGLKSIIDQADGFEVIGEAGDGIELLKLLRTMTPHMVIVDISMPNLRGIEAVRELKKQYPEMKVLVLTMHKNHSYLQQAVSAGAEGYLLKEDTDPELFVAMEKIRAGQKYVSPHLREGMIKDWAQLPRRTVTGSYPGEILTPREIEIVKLIADGKSSKEIGEILFISFRTVERHRANIMDKLGMKKAADVVKYAIQKGYIETAR